MLTGSNHDPASSPPAASADPVRLPLVSADPIALGHEQLKALFPMAVTDGRLDMEKLRAVMGEHAAAGPERYGLSWAGKSNALKALRQLTTATLLPAPSESVNWDTTGHAIIEGDNLEVLKVLQHAYHGKVKLIYIDPPYNTGGDFIYPDDYAEGLASYQLFTRQVNEEGHRLTTNVNTSGRYHSRWLTMIYPRLFLARNLLREDGVIFVSIDDHEVHNLRLVMDEIFGEENFCGMFVWEKKKKPSFLNASMGIVTEYVLAYARERPKAPAFVFGKVEEGKKFPFNNAGNSETILAFPPRSVRFGIPDSVVEPQDMSEGAIKTALLDRLEIRDSTNLAAFRLRGEWRYSQTKVSEFVADGDEIYIAKVPFRPNYINREDRDKKCKNLLNISAGLVGTNEDASAELTEIFGEVVLDYPKPRSLIQFFAQLVTKGDDLVLDFFAGSGTTAHAVLELNKEDGGNRKVILVQLPEPTGRKDFPTIAEITKERARRVIQRLENEKAGELPLAGGAAPDLGFKVFKLAPSNFAIWDPTLAAADPGGLADQWQLTADNVRADVQEQALLHELMLKRGLQLSSPIQTTTVANMTVYLLDEGRLLICLVRELTREALRAMIDLKPQSVLCLDIGFKGNDALKVNAQLEFESHGIQFLTA
jgi:adenine-specific DNA-methyltransferase